MCPFQRLFISNFKTDISTAVFHFNLQKHQDNFLRQFKHITPIQYDVFFTYVQLSIQNTFCFLNQLNIFLVIQLIPRILRLRQRQLLQIGEREADGVIADLTNQPIPRPIFERALHILLLHIQILRHGGERHARRRMIAEHQRVKVHLHKIARRAEHILGDKHIFHGCGIKQRGAVIKRAKRHVSSPFASFLTRLLYHRAGRIGKANKRGESASLPAARALDSLSRRVYNKIGLFCV